ncbi:DUF1499 domain-containing protein, partial [bacterium]|nr:DUF1499 domain-containing protein [bacterium]
MKKFHKKMFVSILVIIILMLIFMTVSAILKNQVPLFDSPGIFKRLSIYLTTNIAQTSDTTDFPELRTPIYQLPAERVYQNALEAVKQLSCEITEDDPVRLQIQAVVTTPLFRFRDDVKIHIEQINPEQSSLTMTSSSRIGRGDLSANAGH